MNTTPLTAVLLLLLGLHNAHAADYFVDELHGDDRNSGSSLLNAWKTLTRASQQELRPGDRLLLRSGDRWAGTLRLSDRGNAQNPITISTFGGMTPAQIDTLEINRGEYLSVSNLIIDPDQKPNDAVLIKHSKQIRLERLEVRNGIKDGIDIQDSEDIEIVNLYIHHFLAGSFHQQKDAHGIAASNTQRLSIVSTEIHHTSGDSFQSDPARFAQKMSNDITIRNSHFWTSPLQRDFNSGWKATAHLAESERQYPGENAIDTKVVKKDWENTHRMRLTVDGLRAHGWKADRFIRNKAVFNLKEKIDISLKNIEVYDCEIALRLRGNRGNAQITINSAHLDRCEVGIRAEGGLQGLRVSNSVFGSGLKKSLVSVGSDTRHAQKSWHFHNNQFYSKAPKFLTASNGQSTPQIIKKPTQPHRPLPSQGAARHPEPDQ